MQIKLKTCIAWSGYLVALYCAHSKKWSFHVSDKVNLSIESFFLLRVAVCSRACMPATAIRGLFLQIQLFFFLEFVVCFLSPLGQIFIQIRWRRNLKRCVCVRFIPQDVITKEDGGVLLLGYELHVDKFFSSSKKVLLLVLICISRKCCVRHELHNEHVYADGF